MDGLIGENDVSRRTYKAVFLKAVKNQLEIQVNYNLQNIRIVRVNIIIFIINFFFFT